MQATIHERRIWIETGVLAGLSAVLALLIYRRFARYSPQSIHKDPSGDAPSAPWDKLKPEEKSQAEPVRRTLDQATAQVNSPEKADQVVEQLEELAGDATTGEVEDAKPPEKAAEVSVKVAESSRRVEQAAKSAPRQEQAAQGIAQAAMEITNSPGRQKAALADATSEALNPEQQGAVIAKNPRQREYLREAMLKRMKPFDALDARLFVAVNGLPRNRWLNGFFYFFTVVFKAGMGWYAIMALALLLNPSRGIRVVRDTVLALTVSTSIVEFPIKTFVRRRRPFIAYIQAIVIGKKPGTWSFPSGHSASAFAGAWLLSRDLPRQRPLLFLIAGLVAFSRIYLGDHYPGDVVSGAFSGVAVAEAVRRVQQVLVRDAGH